jgi:predicted DNA-binding transcriptional regulator YafY
MNRIDRLFAILLMLQNEPRVRAQDLAEKFEVSKRTIYRDITALSEMGVPIVSLPGEGYELIEGFYLPPLVFSDDEALALFLGARLLIQQAAGRLTQKAEQALAKILVALPKESRQRVEALAEIIRFITPQDRFNLDEPQLVTLQQAIQNQQVIFIRYHSYNQNETTEREVEPHQLSYADGAWYVSGYCRLRQGPRSFRLSRIEQLSLQAETFVKQLPAEPETEWIRVQIRFAKAAARWVRERQHYGFQAEELSSDGEAVLMTYCLNTPSEIVPWVLSWGAAAEVLAPQHLREQLRQEAIKLANMLT